MTETYWVGDLCYVMSDVWKEVHSLTFPDGMNQEQGLFTLRDGREYVLFGTEHGDGLYADQEGNEYPVDSGSLGAIRVEDIRDTNLLSLGNLHDIDREKVANLSYRDQGIVVIGETIFIDTDPSYEGEEYHEDGEFEDEK